MSQEPSTSTRAIPGITLNLAAAGVAAPEHCPLPTRDVPFVSVIVPVFDDAERLARCLEALAQQTYPADRYEVIVVDNGSTDGSPDLAARFPRARLEREPEPGSYAARNRGIAVARGEVLAFTDSDCVPTPDWLAVAVAELSRVPSCGLVGGSVELFFRQPERPTVCELYEAIFDFDQERFVTAGRFAMTANLLTTAAVMREVGTFDARLKSVGDRDWGNRVHAAGFAVSYVRGARVRHPTRYRFRKILTKRLRVGGGHHDAARKGRFAKLRLLGALAQLLVRKPARGAVALWRHPPAGPWMTFKTWGLLTVLCYIEAGERIRLAAGGRARR
jgi:glycosyltransferase involved in cell wall biosynthesis